MTGNWAGSLIGGQFGESGLEYRRNRYYDPRQGRFTQEDPIGLAGGMNLYGFASGDPVNFSDPFGLCPENLSLLQGYICNAIEATATLIGSAGGFLGGGGAGFVAALPTGELAAPVAVPAGAVAGLAIGGVAGKLAGEAITSRLFNESAGSGGGGREGAQDKLLSKGEIKRLQDAGVDIHDLKGGKNASRFDLYKNRDGDVLVKPKGGRGPGDPTGLNIRDY